MSSARTPFLRVPYKLSHPKAWSCLGSLLTQKVVGHILSCVLAPFHYLGTKNVYKAVRKLSVWKNITGLMYAMQHWTSDALSIQNGTDILWESNKLCQKSSMFLYYNKKLHLATQLTSSWGNGNTALGYSADCTPNVTCRTLPGAQSDAGGHELALLTLWPSITQDFIVPKFFRDSEADPLNLFMKYIQAGFTSLEHGPLLTWSKYFSDRRANKVVSWLMWLHLDSYPNIRKSNLN